MNREELHNKKVLVLGYGKTGKAVVDFLLEQNSMIIVNDIKKRVEFDENRLRDYERRGVKYIFGEHLPELCKQVDMIVISPGIDPKWMPFDELKIKGIEVISEVELAYRFCKSKIIGITGTNGKTTVTTLLGELFKNNGYKVCICGNIGEPFIKAVEDNERYEYYIIEISSFQLEAIKKFRANGAILLNIADDHLDRYSNIEEYLAAKWNIFKNQEKVDWAILNYLQLNYWEKMPRINSVIWGFSSSGKVNNGCYIEGDRIVYEYNSKKEDIISLKEVKLKGIHNIENIMACIIASKQENISNEKIIEVIRNFSSLPHRMELIMEKDGILFINDSKATNPDAVIKALKGFQKNVILILGGKDKQLGFDVLVEPINEHVKAAILIGEAREKILKAIEESDAEKDVADTIEEAVKKAYSKSKSGDIILLSPACASFDMFKDYVERGNKFKKAVYDLLLEDKQEV